MLIELLKVAKHRVPGTSVLINMISKRVRQLIAGNRPLVKIEGEVDLEDIAIREIAEGKLVAEIDFDAAKRK